METLTKLVPTVHKARKPKFELHLKIYDLNNVPLVSGVSFIKWHLPHSMHGEHRGRTPRCPIANHRVEYNYSKVVPVRVAIDRNSNLAECPIEFEVLQEFKAANDAGPGQGGSSSIGGSSKEQKVTLGTVRLNLSEYVEESEGILQTAGRGSSASATPSLTRTRTSLGSGVGLLSPEQVGTPRSTPRNGKGLDDTTTTTNTASNNTNPMGEEGVVRRYLMQESKVNSTLKIGILMIQMDGDRNFVAPPLRTAPVFGGIAGLMAGEPLEPGVLSSSSASHDQAGARLLGSLGGGGPTAAVEDASAPNSSKSRDASEMHDMYRRALAASWACHADELPADECIEDIFAGGDGFGEQAAHGHHLETAATGSDGAGGGRHRQHHHALSAVSARSGTSSLLASTPATASDDDDGNGISGGATLRPRDVASSFKELTLRPTHHQHRHHGSQSSVSQLFHAPQQQQQQQQQQHARTQSSASDRSLAGTLWGGGVGAQVVSPRRRVRSGSSGLSKGAGEGGLGSRSESFESLNAPVRGSGSHRGRDGFKRVKEVDEAEVREDLVAWAAPREAGS